MAKSLLTSTLIAGNTSAANTTQYWLICGADRNDNQGQAALTEAQTQIVMRSAGTLSNLWVRLTTNSVSLSTSFNSRVNAGAGNQTVSFASSTTGTQTDTTNTDILSAGAKIALQSVPGSGSTGTFVMGPNAFTFAATTNTISRLACFTGAGTTAVSLTRYFPLAGDNQTKGYSSETTGVKCRQQNAGTFQNACASVSANSISAVTTLKGRINAGGTTSNISVSCTASTAGFYEDTTNQDTMAGGEDYDLQLVTGGSGSTITIPTTQIDFSTTSSTTQLVGGPLTPWQPFPPVDFYFFAGIPFTSSGPAAESTVQTLTSNSYTFSDLTVLVTANTDTTTETLTFRANAANVGSISIAITASTSGLYADTTHSYTSASTDLVDFFYHATGGTGFVSLSNVSIWASLGVVVQRSLSDSVSASESVAKRRTVPRPSIQDTIISWGTPQTVSV